MKDFFLGGEGRLVPANAAVALIVVDREHYLLQLRDQKPGIFYPGHWGLFGGALDPGETPEMAIRRELREELGLEIAPARYFTEFLFDVLGHGHILRRFFEVSVVSDDLKKLVLREGAEMRIFSAAEILLKPRVVPYDSFAIWLHASRSRL